MTDVLSRAIGLIEDNHRAVVAYERNIVLTSLRYMRMIEGLRVIPEVTVPTNDMRHFPSSEHPLFPNYPDKRFSQFNYTVDNNGILSIGLSDATTDVLFEKIEQWLKQLPREK